MKTPQQQKRAVVFGSAERRRNKDGESAETGRMLWYVKVTAVTKALLVEKGEKKGSFCLGPIREQWGSKEEAEDRKQRIDEFFFPTSAGCAIPPLTLEQQQACALVLNGHCRSKELGTAWGDDPRLIFKMFDFCRKNKMPIRDKEVPLWVPALNAWIRAGEQGDETNPKRRGDSVTGRKTFRRLTGVIFKNFTPGEVAVETLLNWLRGAVALDGYQPPTLDPEGRVTIPGKLKILDAEGREVDFEGCLPLSWWTAENVQKQYSSFRNWCSQYPRLWCEPVRFKHLAMPRWIAESNKHQAMSMQQFRITLEWYYFAGWNGPIPDPGGATYAANAVDNFFGGKRKTETKRTSGRDTDGYVTVTQKEGKCNPRVNQALPVYLIQKKYLERRGLWEEKNLNLSDSTRSVIHYLAGWDHEREETIVQAERFLRYCEEHGIAIPERGSGWGPYPRNGPRDLSISMHIKLFFDPEKTVLWAGTSTDQLDNWYFCAEDILGHLFTLADGRDYWLHLPRPILEALKDKPWVARWGTKTGTKTFGLPKEHVLDGHLGEEMEEALVELADPHTGVPNPLRVQILEKQVADLISKEQALSEEHQNWRTANPQKLIRDSPFNKPLKATNILLSRTQERLAFAQEGRILPRQVHERLVSTAAEKERWVNLVAWMSRLNPHKKPELAKVIGVDYTTFATWLKQKGERVPLVRVLEMAEEKSRLFGYNPITMYDYLPATGHTPEMARRWDSLAAWASAQPHGFRTKFAKLVGVAQPTASAWFIRGSQRMPLGSLRAVAEEVALSLGWTPPESGNAQSKQPQDSTGIINTTDLPPAEIS